MRMSRICKILLVFLFLFCIYNHAYAAVLGYNTSEIRSGGGIILHVVCVGWTAANRADAETAGSDVDTIVFISTQTTPEKNPFHTYANEFTVYLTTIDSPIQGAAISDIDFQDTLAAAQAVNGFTQDFMLIRENIHDQNVQGNHYSLHGNGLAYEIDNDLTGPSFAYVAAHELAHLVSYKWTIHEPIEAHNNVVVIAFGSNNVLIIVSLPDRLIWSLPKNVNLFGHRGFKCTNNSW